MLAYLSWHRPASAAQRDAYEQALKRFHASLAHQPPSGFRGSASFRADELPWRGRQDVADDPDDGGAGYEDWYLVEDWAALGVLEEAAVARGHTSAHEHVAALAGEATGAVYRLVEGHANLHEARVAAWVVPARGLGRRGRPSLEALLGDGMDPNTGALWRRCLGLGLAPEYCLLAPEVPAGIAHSRLPAGWVATVTAREPL